MGNLRIGMCQSFSLRPSHLALTPELIESRHLASAMPFDNVLYMMKYLITVPKTVRQLEPHDEPL